MIIIFSDEMRSRHRCNAMVAEHEKFNGVKFLSVHRLQCLVSQTDQFAARVDHIFRYIY